jgi:hypothetical protein
MKRRFFTASSRRAWLDGCWPCVEWGVFERRYLTLSDGKSEVLSSELIHSGFRTRREACAWRDTHEQAARVTGLSIPKG